MGFVWRGRALFNPLTFRISTEITLDVVLIGQLENLQCGGEPTLADSRVRVKSFTFDHVYDSSQQTTGGATQQTVSSAVYLISATAVT